MKSGFYFVYILLCSDGTYYTGITNNVNERLLEHNLGLNRTSYTYKRRPVFLQYAEMFHDVNQAIRFEKKIKKWSHEKKRALIEQRYEDLVELSKSRSR